MQRRRFIISGGAAGLAASACSWGGSASVFLTPGKLRVMIVGVIGTIGEYDRKEIAKHPDAEIAVLCDVDARALAKAAAEHPNAILCKDYREAFGKYGDRFDAVVVSTPDHTHAPILLTALAHHKHVYGQKPLVHQLEELTMVGKAIAARPKCATQLGNQRMAFPGRRAAVEILHRGMLGKARAAYIWVNSPNDRTYFNLDERLGDPADPPAYLDWDLWLGPCEKTPYREGIAPVKWRSLWDYGSGGLGDWGCHVLDVVFLAYPELVSPCSVQTDCAPARNPLFHPYPCRSTITYAVSSERFTGGNFPIYFSDSGQAPSRASLGLPPGKYSDAQVTCVVCEGGVLLVSPNGRLEIWRNGKLGNGLKMPGLPEFPKMNHWHAWVDACLGRAAQVLTPFQDAIRISECALLAVKAARFPSRELLWDKKTLSFTNDEEATAAIVRRKYREGFAPPVIS